MASIGRGMVVEVLTGIGCGMVSCIWIGRLVRYNTWLRGEVVVKLVEGVVHAVTIPLLDKIGT